MLHEAGFSLFWFVLGCKIGQICKRQKKKVCSEFTLTAKTRGRENVCNYDKEHVFFFFVRASVCVWGGGGVTGVGMF